jgi:hypothetical protein
MEGSDFGYGAGGNLAFAVFFNRRSFHIIALSLLLVPAVTEPWSTGQYHFY